MAFGVNRDLASPKSLIQSGKRKRKKRKEKSSWYSAKRFAFFIIGGWLLLVNIKYAIAIRESTKSAHTITILN